MAYRESYLHVPSTFRRTSIATRSIFGQNYLTWKVSSVSDIVQIPIYHQEIVVIDENYEFASMNVSLSVSAGLMDIFYSGTQKVLFIVDGDNIPRTISSLTASRLVDSNFYRVNVVLEAFNTYRVYNPNPVSEFISYKVPILNGTVTFDPPFGLYLSQTEVV